MSGFQGFRASRVATFAPEDMTPAQRRFYDQMLQRSRGGLQGPMNVLLRSPEFADAMNALGEFTRQPAAGLTPRVQELVILITAQFWNADYEWWVHVPRAIAAGVPRTAVEDIRARRPPRDLSPADDVVHRFLHTLLHDRRVSDELYDEAKQLLGEAPLIHLVGFAGHYGLLAMILNATETHTPGIPQDELEILDSQVGQADLGAAKPSQP